MIIRNVKTGLNVSIHESSSVNNVDLGDGVKIAKRCSVFGREEHLLEIGAESYVGMNTIINGYSSKIRIGKNCSIAQNVNIMTDSGPNASSRLQRIFPIEKGSVNIGDDCWIGAGVIIMPNVKLGDFCIVAANSFVNGSFDGYTVVGGTPAKFIRKLTQGEIDELLK